MRNIVSRLIRWALATAMIAGLLFGVAGRTPGTSDLPWFQAYVVVFSLLVLVASLTIDPDLAKERRRPGPGGIDRAMHPLAAFLFLAHLVVAGLDAGRFHWSGTVPDAGRLAGLVVFAAGMGLILWAMNTNRFFSPVVRIQSERGHHLVTSGPYGYVRHPGYVGMLFAAPASAVALGSWWAMLPVAAYVLLGLRRAALEDRFLLQNLEGYPRYAEQVPHRLMPGLW